MTVAPRTDALYRAFSDELRGFIAVRVRDDALAEDLLHDVFLKVHARLDDLEDAERVRGWLYRIARNAVIDHGRKAVPAPPPPEPEADLALHRWVAASLGHFIDALPEADRDALRLVELEGLSQVELAERLGLSLSGARSRVQRARRRLRAALEDCCAFEADRYGHVIRCDTCGA